MPNDDRTKLIPRRTPESAAMSANVKRAMAITATLNRLTFNDADEVRALFSDFIGKKVDESFVLIPPFYTTGGVDINVGRNGVIATPIVIEGNVWIAAGATIIGGVTVGENSVIAAGSVVTRDVPPNALVGGNPARVIRSIGD